MAPVQAAHGAADAPTACSLLMLLLAVAAALCAVPLAGAADALNLEGRLSIMDSHTGGGVRWYLTTGSGPADPSSRTYQLPGQPADGGQQLQVGDWVTLTCTLLPGSASACGEASGASAGQAPPGGVPGGLSASLGASLEMDLLVLVVSFTGSCAVAAPYSVEQLTSLYMGAGGHAQRFDACSYSKLRISQAKFKVLSAVLECTPAMAEGCSALDIAYAADAAAAPLLGGRSPLTVYTHVSYVLPAPLKSACGWVGLATTPGPRTWLLADENGVEHRGTVMQELLHNFGLRHSWRGGQEYEDYSTCMGKGDACPSAFELARLRWATPLADLAAADLAPGEVKRLSLPATRLGGSGAYVRVRPDWLGESGYLHNLYVALRTRGGGDAALDDEFSGKASIHRADRFLDSPSKALDGVTSPEPYVEFMAALAPGTGWQGGTRYRLVLQAGALSGDTMTIALCRYSSNPSECKLPDGSSSGGSSSGGKGGVGSNGGKGSGGSSGSSSGGSSSSSSSSSSSGGKGGGGSGGKGGAGGAGGGGGAGRASSPAAGRAPKRGGKSAGTSPRQSTSRVQLSPPPPPPAAAPRAAPSLSPPPPPPPGPPPPAGVKQERPPAATAGDQGAAAVAGSAASACPPAPGGYTLYEGVGRTSALGDVAALSLAGFSGAAAVGVMAGECDARPNCRGFTSKAASGYGTWGSAADAVGWLKNDVGPSAVSTYEGACLYSRLRLPLAPAPGKVVLIGVRSQEPGSGFMDTLCMARGHAPQGGQQQQQQEEEDDSLVRQWPCANDPATAPARTWRLEAADGGLFLVYSLQKAAECLAVHGPEWANDGNGGERVFTWQCDGYDDQQWALAGAPGAGYQLTSKAYGPNQCLTSLAGGQASAGALFKLLPCGSSGGQTFFINEALAAAQQAAPAGPAPGGCPAAPGGYTLQEGAGRVNADVARLSFGGCSAGTAMRAMAAECDARPNCRGFTSKAASGYGTWGSAADAVGWLKNDVGPSAVTGGCLYSRVQQPVAPAPGKALYIGLHVQEASGGGADNMCVEEGEDGNIQQVPCAGDPASAPARTWLLRPLDGEYYTLSNLLHPANSATCLAAHGPEWASEGNVGTFTAECVLEYTDQHWAFVGSATAGYQMTTRKYRPDNLCLGAVSGSQAVAGGLLLMAPCDGSAGQTFFLNVAVA